MISYKKIFHICVFILFVCFLVLYFANVNGYYANLQNEKVMLTEEKIEEFEKDIKEGKKIEPENYLINLKKDYSNKVSNFGLYTSKTISKYFKKAMFKLFENVGSSIEE